ncbi:hypothetical protein BJ944DRAFT_240968 [Cunninghamella echinulata]|nr:hypothetical protein BJ944DRAFT_240968 [Cunninghamella echinulata]
MRVLPLLVLCLALVFGVNAGISAVTKPLKTAYSIYKFFKKLLVSNADKPLTNYAGHQSDEVFLQTRKIKGTDSNVHVMTQMLADDYSTNVFQQVEVALGPIPTAKCVNGFYIGCTNSVGTYISYGTKPNWGWGWNQLSKWDSEAKNELGSCNSEC